MADSVPSARDSTSVPAPDRALSTAAFMQALFSGGVATARVDPAFFEVFGVPILTGRGFRAEDATPESNAIIVNRAFVTEVLGGARPLGRRILVEGRGCSGMAICEDDVGKWLEIVGVVPDFPDGYGLNAPMATYYRPLRDDDSYPLILNVRVRGISPEAFADRLRNVARSVDPMLRITGAAPLDDALAAQADGLQLINVLVTLVALSTVLISAAGIAALMAFTVTQRRREIAIRLAIGAQRKHVVRGVFARASAQIGLGLIVGLSFVALSLSVESNIDAQEIRLLGAIVVVMSAVGFAATWGPARRALRIQPTEALKGE
jgi:putative ABC transport system permease protein